MESWWRLSFKVFLALAVAVGLVLVYINANLTKQFESLSWAVGAKMFARPLELYQDAPFSADQVRYELELLNYRLVDQLPNAGQYRVLADALIIGTRGHAFPDGVEPARRIRISFDDGQVAQIQTDTAKAVDLIRLEPVMLAQLSGTHADRELTTLDALPPGFIDLLLAVEDQQFYTHAGLSWTGIARAAWNNLEAGRFAQGGSTLTQQLVKNLYLSRERTLSRKALEAVYALLLDANFSKEAILEAYINEVFLGQWGNRAVHGFATAAQFYFGQPLQELSRDQHALLIALVKGPSAFNPRRHPERATARRNLVLDIGLAQGLYTQSTAAQAKARPLDVPRGPADRIGRFPGYVQLVKRELTRDYSSQQLTQAGLSIYTALDPQVHRGLVEGRQTLLERLKTRGLDPKQEAQLGALMVDIPTGEIQAVLASRNDRPGFHRVLDARRQIGSLAKPFVVAAALDMDPRLYAGTLVRDESIAMTDNQGRTWSPRNYDETEAGVVLLERVIADSINQATVHLALGVGLDGILDRMDRYGIPIGPSRPPASVLGVSEMSPFQVASQYQALLNRGYRTPLKAVRSVISADGTTLTRRSFQSKRRIPVRVAVMVEHMMRVGAISGTGKAFGRRYDQILASKTGTTDDGRDAWFVGADGRRLGVTWVGFDDNRTAGLVGAEAALPVISDAFAHVSRMNRPTPLPDALHYVWLNPQGQIVGAGCPETAKRPVPVAYERVPAGRCSPSQSTEGGGAWLDRWFGG
jgi:penicillin-binding protein 1B